jgi:hypothetical protein
MTCTATCFQTRSACSCPVLSLATASPLGQFLVHLSSLMNLWVWRHVNFSVTFDASTHKNVGVCVRLPAHKTFASFFGSIFKVRMQDRPAQTGICPRLPGLNSQRSDVSDQTETCVLQLSSCPSRQVNNSNQNDFFGRAAARC